MKRLLALILVATAWIGAACGRDQTTRPLETARTTTSTSTSTSTTTTTIPPPPTTALQRASRAAVRPNHAPRPRPTSPPQTHVTSPAPAASAEGCSGYGYKSKAYSDSCWRPYVAQYSWPVERMLAILHCESKGDPWAKNGKHVGLFQIANSHTQGDGPGNIAHAWGVYQSAAQRGRPTQPWAQCGG